MLTHEWPAEDYAVGAYIQATIADKYVIPLQLNPHDSVLDIGCGDGSYTVKILKKIPEGTLIGVDRSQNMLALAKEKVQDYPYFSVQKSDVLDLTYDKQFDYIVSFWCLQWCDDLPKAFSNIYRALKKGGKLLTIIPSGNDPLVRSLERVKASMEFKRLQDFILPVNYKKIALLPDVIQTLPFSTSRVECDKQTLVLPSLDVFKKFVKGLALFNGQIPDDEIPDINKALVNAYDVECQQNYQGECRCDISVYVVTAEK